MKYKDYNLPTILPQADPSKKNKSSELQKGVSIYFALMIMTILLAIALGMSTILIGQIKMIKRMEDSVIALYAADAGIEKILYDASTGIDITDPEYNPCPPPPPCICNLGDACYTVTVLPYTDPDCPGDYYCIKSTGIYRKTRRAIQATR